MNKVPTKEISLKNSAVQNKTNWEAYVNDNFLNAFGSAPKGDKTQAFSGQKDKEPNLKTNRSTLLGTR